MTDPAGARMGRSTQPGVCGRSGPRAAATAAHRSPGV